jgi:hypothetical protein
MAINWQPAGSAQSVVIGGSVTSAANIIAGPFPKFSISRECIRKDNLYLGQKYSINITGTAVIVESSNMLEIGKRQQQIHDIVKKLMRVDNRQGKLYIEDYGSQSQVLTFNDAVLLSVEAAEQSDDSRGVQVQQYSFTFEATDLNNGGNDENDPHPSGSIYNVVDVSENWDFSLNDNDYSYNLSSTGEDYNADNDTIIKKYTISHNLSATGVTKYSGAGTNVSSGYYEAKRYIQNRLDTLGNNPFNVDTIKDYGTGTPGADTIGQHNIFEADDTEGAGTNLRPYQPSEYSAYNQVNTYSQDILNGTYSVTRTWLASKAAANVTLDLTYNDDQASANRSVEVALNIQGYESIVEDTLSESGSVTSSANPNTDTTNKYSNALTVAGTYTDAVLYNVASAFYTSRRGSESSDTLKSPALSRSESHSKTTGSINISSTFDDRSITVANAISENLTISDSNYNGSNQIVAILPVIAKSDGPVIQNMGTTNERTRSVSIEIVMKRGSGNPSGSVDLSAYKPDGAYQQNFSESWSPTSRSYNQSIDWVWSGDAGSSGDGGVG